MAVARKDKPAATDNTIDVGTAAKLALCTPQWIHALVGKGFIRRASRGRYTVIDVVHGRIKSLQEEQKTTTKSAADSRLKDLKAREVEIRIAQAEHRLIGTEEALAVLDEVVGTIRAECAALPAKVSREVAVRRMVENELNGVFARAAERLAERGAALRASGEAVPADDEDDT